ncbi:Fic family protein [Yaniella halotolerans]|uniref:Fic family protein n=1 Tax=Yaniella halotolerans TaxID=225453 RepID=UPI000684DCBF|nr:Fic family protein [Yaniella halotolerans]
MAQTVNEDLARFDAQYEGGAPFSAVLLRSESSASSQIEHLTANARRIALARLGDNTRRNASLIARNTMALEAALQLADDLTVNAMLEMHRALLNDSDPKQAGRLRKEPVWIGGHSPVSAMFVPPEHSTVSSSLEDLVEFMQRTDIPAIAQAAIAHAQFETIHPFTDGNGRTGRALVSAILRSRGTTQNFTVPLSSGLLTDTEQYFEALNAYRRGSIIPIIEQFVAATRSSMANVQVLLNDIETLRAEIYATAQRKTKNLQIVANLCVMEPAFTVGMVQERGVALSTAYKILDRLVERNLLRTESKIGGQSVWSVRVLTDALDAFAERANRRS